VSEISEIGIYVKHYSNYH